VTPEIALYFLGALLVPVAGWGIKVNMILASLSRQNTDVSRKCDKLINMHENPDDYGFGTTRTNQIIEDNTRAMTALTHYIQWLVKEQTGHDAPPPIEGISHG